MKGGNELNYHIQHEISIEELLQTLNWTGSISIDSKQTEELSWFDTFDWRLFDARLILEQQGQEWSLRNGFFGSQIAMDKLRRQARFASNFNPGPMKTKLSAILEPRALYYVCSAICERYEGAFLNEDEKKVVRFFWYQLSFNPTDDSEQSAFQHTWIRLQALRGYEDQERIIAAAFHEAGYKAGTLPTMNEVWTNAGFKPGDYQSKPQTPMASEISVSSAVSALISQMKVVVEANIDGMKADIDSEFLHDYRVALRRSRSLLKQLKGVYAPEMARPLNQALRTLAKATNQMRDLDVHLLAESQTRALLPENLGAQLSPFYTYLRKERRRARRAMLTFLDSAEFEQAMSFWQRSCQPSPDQIGPKGNRPVKAWIDKKLRKVYGRILSDGHAINAETPDQALHDLRIVCKQLRYLLECFSALYPRDIWKSFVKMLKGLQNVLGHFNDLHVQQGVIQGYADTHPRESSFALGVLSGILAADQRATRQAFQKGFDDFAKSTTRAMLDSLITSGESS